ncbi:Uma2 family endonuclease [Runella defluvii]|uniref:Uma2 family endonuclease n=1 Tax=Runella defluvii TaxID=370973 RepID=A0A7W5ZGX5_9BACT|nr:Uma2 family endonuclease [Runella defluvii]MBB3836365.1 Uma2 family endonuclease [Runella defluvii]
MSAQLEKKHYTLEEYFELDNQSEVRYEFYEGEVFAMAGTSKNHNIITDNIQSALKRVFRPKGCDVFSESVKLEAIKNAYYPYPDVMVSCDERDKEDEYVVAYPSVLVEVLSKSTAEYDKDFKLKKYKKIPSVQYYLIVSQYECSVELYSRTDNPELWLYQTYEKLTDTISFDRLGFTLAVSTIYESVRFSAIVSPFRVG